MSKSVPLGSDANDESVPQVSTRAPGQDAAQAHIPTQAPETVLPARASAIAYEAVLTGYSGLFAPVAATFEQLARMATLVCDAPIVTVNIAHDARLWFPANEGPADGGTLHGPSPSADLNTPTVTPLPDSPQPPSAPYIINDTAGDPRTREHPWVTAKNGIRFLAIAAIQTPEGRHLGTLEVMDRKPHRVSDQQIQLLAGLGATIAQLLNQRVSALATLRAADDEHTAELLRRDTAEQITAQLSQAATAARDRLRPQWCQLGGTPSCRQSAELKIADAWGDSAWACWEHAEDALLHVPSVFLATVTSPHGLQAYRHRTPRPATA
jgi:GAF domain-containing protein